MNQRFCFQENTNEKFGLDSSYSIIKCWVEIGTAIMQTLLANLPQNGRCAPTVYHSYSMFDFPKSKESAFHGNFREWMIACTFSASRIRARHLSHDQISIRLQKSRTV